MVTITNGRQVFTVTNGAFREIYSKQGFSVYDPSKPAAEAKLEPTELDDDSFVEAVEEKPISKWSKAEVRRYAEVFGIDISGTRNVTEAKALIKEFRAEAEDAE